MGYAIAHPRLNPVGILPPGSHPSDVHFYDGIIAVDVRFIAFVDAMTCEACEAETQARHIARGKRSATPGCHHPPPSGIRIGCELHIIHGPTTAAGLCFCGRIEYAPTFASGGIYYAPSGEDYITAERLQIQIIRILFDTSVSVFVGWVCNRAAVVGGGERLVPT